MICQNTVQDFDAAIQVHLPNCKPDILFSRSAEIPSFIIYHFSDFRLGSLGEIRLRRIGDNSTELSFSDVPYPSDQETHRYMTLETSMIPKEERLPRASPSKQRQNISPDEFKSLSDLIKVALHVKRVEAQKYVINCLLSNLINDGLLVKKSSWLQMQQFIFDDDALYVCQFLMDGGESRTLKLHDDVWAFEGYLSFAPTAKVLYSIVISVNISDGKELGWNRDNAIWLVHNKEVAEIALIQEKPKECKGILYIESSQWGWSSDGSVRSKEVGSRFIGQFWQDSVIGWMTRNKSSKKGGRPGLDHDELIYRLAKAAEAEEIKLRKSRNNMEGNLYANWYV